MKKIIIFSTVMILLVMGVMMCMGSFAHPSSIVPTVQPTEEPAPSEAPTTQPSTEKTENILPDDEL